MAAAVLSRQRHHARLLAARVCATLPSPNPIFDSATDFLAASQPLTPSAPRVRPPAASLSTSTSAPAPAGGASPSSSSRAVPQMPAFDHVPAPYTGPRAEEVLRKRQNQPERVASTCASIGGAHAAFPQRGRLRTVHVSPLRPPFPLSPPPSLAPSVSPPSPALPPHLPASPCAHQLHVVEGRMQYLYDEDGRRYLDAFAGIVTVSVGHCHPAFVEAVGRQNALLQHTTSIYLNHQIAEYAEELAAKMPGNLKNVYFVNSGSEANDMALTMARLFTGNYDVIALRNAYHGMSPATMGLTAHSTWKFNVPQGFGIHHALNPDPYRGVFGADAAKYAADVDDLLRSSTSGRVAGFIAETIQGVGGTVPLTRGYLPLVYESIRAAGGVCIADEVQTGFGRTGSHYWGFETQGVTPDIVTMAKRLGCISTPSPRFYLSATHLPTLPPTTGHRQRVTTGSSGDHTRDSSSDGPAAALQHVRGNPVSCAGGRAVIVLAGAFNLPTKPYHTIPLFPLPSSLCSHPPQGIGNGLPLAAVVTTPEIAAVMAQRLHFNTFGGNPVSCAGGRAVLRIIEEEALQGKCAHVGGYLMGKLQGLKEKHEGEVAGWVSEGGSERLSD
ncbi:unnamed protein product [Closterium sp. NIES-53]